MIVKVTKFEVEHPTGVLIDPVASPESESSCLQTRAVSLTENCFVSMKL